MMNASRVHRDESVSRAEPLDERFLLCRVQRFADIRRADEENYVVTTQLVGSKSHWILRYIDVETVVGAELREPVVNHRNRRVAVPGRFGKHEHSVQNTFVARSRSKGLDFLTEERAGVFDDLHGHRLGVDVISLVPGTKIEDITAANLPEHATAKMFAPCPALIENQFIRLRHMKRLIVHLRFGQRELRGDAVRNGMFWQESPNGARLHGCATTWKHAGRPLNQHVPFAVIPPLDARIEPRLLAAAWHCVAAPLNKFRHSPGSLAYGQHF